MKPDRSSAPVISPEQHRYFRILDSLNIGMMLFTPNFYCLGVNETVIKLSGRPHDYWVGHNLRDWYGEKEYETIYNRVQESVQAALQNNKNIFQVESYAYHVNGDLIQVLCTCSVNYDSSGKVASVWLLVTDIRELKKNQEELEAHIRALKESRNALKSVNTALSASKKALENEKKMLETILFGIGDCVRVFDPSGNLLAANPLGMKLFGNRRNPELDHIGKEGKEIRVTGTGDDRCFQAQIFEIEDNRGESFAYAEILRDMTDHLRLEAKERELLRVKREMRRYEMQSRMIGRSRAMQTVFDTLRRCAEVDSSVLIQGETGAGKEMAARALHAQSHRKDHPFVVVNCGALPETLLESELFGHKKGAFTGAISDHPGLFREAQGGILFLDEIGDLTQPLQVKLLRAIQEKEIRPLGDKQSYRIDVRIITATHQDLSAMTADGSFRRDLFYRIAVIPLTIPPLRNRKADILPLADHFVRKHGIHAEHLSKKLSHSAQEILMTYPWPGNVRELENCIEHAIAMSRSDSITPEALPVHIVHPLQEASPRPPAVSSVSADHGAADAPLSSEHVLPPWQSEEKAMIEQALLENKGNRTKAARSLGICRTTLWRKIGLYRIQW